MEDFPPCQHEHDGNQRPCPPLTCSAVASPSSIPSSQSGFHLPPRSEPGQSLRTGSGPELAAGFWWPCTTRVSVGILTTTSPNTQPCPTCMELPETGQHLSAPGCYWVCRVRAAEQSWAHSKGCKTRKLSCRDPFAGECCNFVPVQKLGGPRSEAA